jgi:hypothetical protein
MAFSLGDLLADVKGSRYYQIWLVAWLGMLILFFVGMGNITAISGPTNLDSNYKTYRIWEEDGAKTAIRWPRIGWYPNDPTVAVADFFCNTQDEKIIPTMNISYMGRIMQVLDPRSFLAVPAYNDIGCLLMLQGSGDPNQDLGTTWMFVDDGIFHPDSEYVQVDTSMQATMYLSKSTYQMLDGNSYTYWNPFLNQERLRNSTGDIEIIFSIVDFNVAHYLEYTTLTYSGWQAYADLGGILFASYVFQGLFMFLVGLIVTNDSRLLNLGGGRGGSSGGGNLQNAADSTSSLVGGSRGNYDTVA